MNDWEMQCNMIPDGVQTLSKMPSKHVNGIYPKFIEKAQGALIWDDQGREYIDYPLGLGPILLGHNFPSVNKAVIDQLSMGTIFSLPSKRELELAEKLHDYIPSCEMIRFLKTGSESCSAAVKIARAYTGRHKIVACGYHGWHDWYNVTTPKNKGVPQYNAKMCVQVPYNDIEAVKREVTNSTAAMIIEPYVYVEPKDSFLEKVLEVCRASGALLIFDEVVTGFRTMHGTAQKMYGVTPDLTCLGKALGNGFAIGGVCGKRDVMKVLEGDCFVSSTFGGELVGIAAACQVMNVLKREPVIEEIWQKGQKIKNRFNEVCRAENLNAECIGHPCRTYFRFPTATHKSLFWQECIKRGIFFGHAQFMSYSHTNHQVDRTCDAIGEGLRFLKAHWEHPELEMRGDIATETLRIEAEREQKTAD